MRCIRWLACLLLYSLCFQVVISTNKKKKNDESVSERRPKSRRTTQRGESGESSRMVSRNLSEIIERAPAQRSIQDWSCFPDEVLRFTAESLNLPASGQSSTLARRIFNHYAESRQNDQPSVQRRTDSNPLPIQSNEPRSFALADNLPANPSPSLLSHDRATAQQLSTGQSHPTVNEETTHMLRSLIRSELSSHMAGLSQNINSNSDQHSSRRIQANTNPMDELPTPPPIGPSLESASGSDTPSQFLPALPGKVIDQIRNRNFDINFELLLPSPTPQADEYEMKISDAHETASNPVVSLIPRKSTRIKITSFPTWLTAWNNFIRATNYYHPQLTSQLLFYQSRISFYATQYDFTRVYAYDQMFRARITHSARYSTAAIPLPRLRWDRQDEELFNNHLRNAPRPNSNQNARTSSASNNAICFNCQTPGHLRPDCPYDRQSSSTNVDVTSARPAQPNVHTSNQALGQPFRAPQRVCSFFNNGDQCTDRNCRFRHACRLCRGNHPATTCYTRFHRS